MTMDSHQSYSSRGAAGTTRVAVTLNDVELRRLDELAQALDRRWLAEAVADAEYDRRRAHIAKKPRTRAEAIKVAISQTLDGIA
jgi:hypothetical protein